MTIIPFHSSRHRSKLFASQTCSSQAPRSDDRPHSAHAPVNTSFRQAPDKCCVHPQARSARCALNPGCLVSPFRLQSNARRGPDVAGNRSGHLITIWITSPCRPVVSVAQQGPCVKSHSLATLIANLERPPASWQPAFLMHSCISLSTCFVPKSAGFSHPCTLAMVSSRPASASCTHKTRVWRCLTLPTPRRQNYRLRRHGVHSYTWLDHFGHISSHGHRVKSSRSNLGGPSTSGFLAGSAPSD